MKRIVIAIMVALTASAMLFAGGQKEASGGSAGAAGGGEKVELNIIYAKDDIYDDMEKMVNAFMAENPNVEIVHEMYAAEFDSVVRSRDAAGELPDVFATFNVGALGIQDWVESGKVADVSDFAVVKQLPEDVTSILRYPDGNIYSVLVSNTAYPVIYNKELFRKAGISEVPRTLDEMKSAVDKLNSAGITPFVAGAKDGWTLGNMIWRPALDAFFPREWNERLQENDASFHEYGMGIFDFLDLYLANTQERMLDTDYMTQLALFADGEGAMIIQGPWAINNMIEMVPEIDGITGAFPIPFTNDEEKNDMFVMQELAFLVSSESDLETVDAFFDFMINGKGRQIYSEDFALINPFGIDFEANNVVSDIMSYINNGDYIYNYQDNNMPSGYFMVNSSTMQEYAGGRLSKEEVLDKMDEAWTELTGN